MKILGIELDLELFILLAGLGHFALLSLSLNVPRLMDWKGELAPLKPQLQKMFWVYGYYIILAIAAFGFIATLNSGALASGSRLARSISGLIAVFWGARLYVQFFLFELDEWLTTPLYKWGYRLLTLLFGYFTVVFAWAAVVP